jgi:hypothetical protein
MRGSAIGRDADREIERGRERERETGRTDADREREGGRERERDSVRLSSQQTPRALHLAHAQGLMGFLGGWAFFL